MFGVACKGEPFSFGASEASANKAFERALTINQATIKTILLHEDISPLLPYLHVWLAFLCIVSHLPPDKVPSGIFNWPWETLDLDSAQTSGAEQPLPENYAMRGLKCVSLYLPEKWFEGDGRDADKRVVEKEWMTQERARRCAWLKKHVVKVKQRSEEKT